MKSANELDETDVKRQIDLAVKMHGIEHTETALAHMDLGDYYELHDQYAPAEVEYKKAADIFDRLGMDHELLLAIAVKSAAEMAKIQGKDGEAGFLKGQARQLVREYCSRDFHIDNDGDAA